MSRTNEESEKWEGVPRRKWEVGSGKFLTQTQTGQLIAEWQEGPQTISGYASRKLRLTSQVGGGKSELGSFNFPLRTSAFPLPGPLGRLVQGTTLGLSAKKERI